MVEEREEKTEESTKILVHIKRDDEERSAGSADDSSVGSLEVKVLLPASVDEARGETKIKVIIKATDNFGDANAQST